MEFNGSSSYVKKIRENSIGIKEKLGNLQKMGVIFSKYGIRIVCEFMIYCFENFFNYISG